MTAQNNCNRVRLDGDFWNDVFDYPYKKNLNNNSSSFHVKASNPKRLIKFETFLIKHGQVPHFIAEEKSRKLVGKINRMLSNAKINEESRKRTKEQNIKEKEVKEINQCTFAPRINKKCIKESLSIPKNINTSVYDRNLLWSKNLKGKKARQRQTKAINIVECSFQPTLNDPQLDIVFSNRFKSGGPQYQNHNYLKTQETNKKKRMNSFDCSFPQPTEKRIKNVNSSSMKNHNLLIDALRSELRNNITDLDDSS